MYWLLVERPDNWSVDRSQGFKRFGLPSRSRKRASQLRAGHILFSYVSGGVSCLSDIGEVSSDQVHEDAVVHGYDEISPLAIDTRPLLVLERTEWIPIMSLLNDLTFTREHKDWRQLFRVTLRALSEPDGSVLWARMHNGLKETKNP